MIESMHKRSHTVTMMSWEMQLFVVSIFKQSGTAQIQASLSFDRGVFYIFRESRISKVENGHVPFRGVSRILFIVHGKLWFIQVQPESLSFLTEMDGGNRYV